ncbi:hypothetical protein ACFJGW_09365 [Burkholderiaceae bacterium UC74_6]
MKRAEVLQHGVLRECTLVLQRKPRLPLLPWEKDSAGSERSVLTAKIGGVELEDGSEYLVICDDKRYTIKIEMALGLGNHGRVVTEWPNDAPAPVADPTRQLQCW